MLRIALTHMRHADTGGTERYLNQLAAHLADAGHAVTIVCRSHESSPHPAVRFERLRPFATGAAWRLWSFAKAVERHVARERYDVVYGLGRTWSQDLLRLGGGVHRTYLELAHENTRSAWERRLRTGAMKQRAILALERRALAPGACWRIVCNAEFVKRDVVARFGADPERIEVIRNGVDVERFHPRLRADAGARVRAEAGFAPEDTVVLFLGTGYGRKGLAELLDAFPALARARPEARLLVVGFDSDAAAYAARAERLGLAQRVRFLGGRTDAPACFAAADVYALPTRYDPFANSTLEALATGLPVITTDANGGGEILTEGVEGSVLRSGRSLAELERALVHWTGPARAAGSAAARALALRHGHALAMARSQELVLRCAAAKRVRA